MKDPQTRVIRIIKHRTNADSRHQEYEIPGRQNVEAGVVELY